jgi:hypothetical protein
MGKMVTLLIRDMTAGGLQAVLSESGLARIGWSVNQSGPGATIDLDSEDEPAVRDALVGKRIVTL